jgi:cation:H+ antiporter
MPWMDLVFHVFVFSVSLVVLSKASHVVVDNTVKLARMTRIGELSMGFILLSVVSNLPEIFVGFSAITAGIPEISIGNLLGSNITDLTLTIGLTAVIMPIMVVKKNFKKLTLILLLSSVVPLAIFGLAEAGRIVGAGLIAAFVLFSVYSVRKKITLDMSMETPGGVLKKILRPFRFYKCDILIAIGILVIIVASRFVVWSTSNIAGTLGISGSVLGATIVSLGTVMPELSVSLSGIRKRHYSLVLGNTIGSCLTKVTLILGIVLLLSPLKFDIGTSSGILAFLILSTAIVMYFTFSGKKIDRMEGIALIIIYVVYLMFAFGLQITILELLA